MRQRLMQILYGLCLVALLSGGVYITLFYNVNISKKLGQQLDELDGVAVYYNGGLYQQAGVSRAENGFLFGVRYQSSEFVRRFYQQRLSIALPEDFLAPNKFFDSSVDDGRTVPKLNLIQYHNGSTQAPEVNDIVVFSPAFWNPQGGVGIVSKVGRESIEVVQQNVGPFMPSREHFLMHQERGHWVVAHDRVLGWLRPLHAK